MKTKILIIEHDSKHMELIQHELKKGNVHFVTEIVQTKEEYTNALDNFKPDIILSNYTFPSFDGLTALKIREKLVPETPFIFISESIGEENAVALIKNGATDFVLKEQLRTLSDKINRALEEAATIKLRAAHKQSEENRIPELWQNESQYRSLFENSMNGILLTITDGRILSANPAACEIFEMTEQEIIEAGRFGIADNTDPRLKQLLEERQQTGRAKGELTLLRKNGIKFPAELTSTVFKDSQGEERTSMIIKDISERKETEQKLAKSTDELQQALNDLNKILDSSLDIICSVDKEGYFVSVSAASERIWGYSPNELIGKKYIDLVFPEDAIKTLDTDTNIQSGVPVTMFENRYIHKDGHIVPMLWSSRWDETDQLSYGIAKDATDKKNLEKAFEIERQRFHDLYSQAPSCMAILKGPNHIYEMANPLYLQLIEKEDIIGKTVKELMPELEGQGIFELLDTVYKTGETFSANEMLVKLDFHGNGKLVDTYLNFIYQAHRSIDGIIDGIFVFVNDVTEQVLSRKKIEESVLRYSSLIEQASDAICILDASMKIIDVNRYACKKLGYTKTEILQFSIADFFLEEDLKANPLKLNILKERKTLRGERRVKRKDQTLIDVELSAKMLKDGSTLLFARDITEHKKAQQTLKENEKKYRYLFDNNPLPMWITELNTFKFLDVNKMAIQQYGYSREEFLSMTAIDIREEKDKESFRQFNETFEDEPENFNKGIWNHQKKNGTVIQVEILAHNINYEGVPARFVLSNDITDRRKAELNLEKRNKELIKTNSELDRFVYSVSHDLRSPLTSILGVLSFIETESLEPDTLEHAEMIRNSINRLDDFIKNILSYSRNNRIQLEIQKIPLQQTTLDIVESLQSMTDAKGIAFGIDIKEQQPFYTDSLRFNTIMENLISNAIKHHKKSVSGRYIKITGYSDKEKLQLTIADNGIGIAPEYHQKIFDMFFRVSGNTDGSGIGLYIVKDTIEKLNGFIDVASELDNGTTFTITLKNLNNERSLTTEI